MTAKASAPEVQVEDVMSSPVVTIKDSDTVLAAAKLMKKHEIGCVVVVDKSGKPVGLMTERDVVRRVTALDVPPGKIMAKKVMTKPPITVEPGASVTEAARKMKNQKVRRLIVVEKDKIQGIITSNDIVDITPALIDVMAEKSAIEPIQKPRETAPLAGYCDRCGSWTEDLKSYDGQFYCEDCLADVEEPEA